ncbi:MAG: murein biosynthesis integral membrane protein MurJ [Candidatus Pacebacteria bacterium]|nr:murein biosynthesis integral membrane protein MurJ [Candidatus Paceibacterota bacterium]
MIFNGVLFTIEHIVMINRLLNSKTKTVSAAVFFVAFSTFLGYLLAILRDNFLANFLTNAQADVYWAAFRVPDFVYGLLITGGVTAAFLPVLADYWHKDGQEAKNLFKNVFTFFLLILSALSLLLAVFAPFIIKVIVPGFSASQQAQTVVLSRIMFLSPIILGISAIFSVVLQFFDLFIAFSLAPVFYNLGIIVGIIFFLPLMGLPGLAWGVVLGALLHLLIQVIPLLKTGFTPGLFLKLKSAGLAKVFRLMIPRTIGAGAYHLNLIIITAIASTLAAGSIKIFNLANNLYGVPVGLIGVPFATAAFPLLSRCCAGRENEKFLKILSQIFSRIIFLIIPLSALFFLFRAQIVRLFYGTRISGGGYFGWWETRLTAGSLGIFAFSLFAVCLIPLLARAFYSLHDTKTPVKIAVFAIAFNIFLVYFFVKILGSANVFSGFLAHILKLERLDNLAVLGLPLALSISAIWQFFGLLFYLKRKVNFKGHRFLEQFFLIKVLVMTLVCSLTAYLCLRVSSQWTLTNTVLGILEQIIFSALSAVLVYCFLSLAWGFKEPVLLWRYCVLFFKRFKVRNGYKKR